MLEWAVQIARKPMVLGRHSGQAAYTAWAAQILCDSDFATDNPDILRQRYEVHNSAVGIVAECRSWAASFLTNLYDANPAIGDELLQTAQYYREQHSLMWKIWGLVGGNWQPEAYLRFADAEVRRKTADIILAARDLDEQAAKLLKRVAARL